MGRPDAPFLRIEIVRAIAQMFDEAQRHALIAHEQVALRQPFRQGDRLFPQIADSLFPGQLCVGECRRVQLLAQRERLRRDQVFSLRFANNDTCREDSQSLVSNSIEDCV